MITLLALLLFVAVLFVTLAVGLLLGASAYVDWRWHQRESLREDPIARVFYGPYESPFPWHKKPPASDKKGVA